MSFTTAAITSIKNNRSLQRGLGGKFTRKSQDSVGVRKDLFYNEEFAMSYTQEELVKMRKEVKMAILRDQLRSFGIMVLILFMLAGGVWYLVS